MKVQDYVLLGGLALGAYILYKSFYGGTSRGTAIRSLQASGGTVYNSAANPGYVNAAYVQGARTVTYSFSPEELPRYNWAQQILNQVGFIPKSWIFGG